MNQTGIIHVTTKAPSKLTDELTLAGFRVWEALSESEVFSLAEQYPTAVIVISADVDTRTNQVGPAALSGTAP